MRRCLGPICCVALLALAIAPFASSASAPPPPFAPTATVNGSSAVVTWASSEVPDYFTIYGVTGGSRTFIETVSGNTFDATAPGNFTAYAITATVGGTESDPAIATPCVRIDPWHLAVYVGCI